MLKTLVKAKSLCYNIEKYTLDVMKMKITYKKLWHLLIDKEMNKKDLIEKADISQSTLYKLTKDGNVNTDILIKICIALECDLTDIMELVPLEGK